MKRLIVTIILITVIVGVLTYFMPKSLDSYIKDVCAEGAVSIYCRNTDVDAIDVGCGKIVECSVGDFYNVVARCKDIDGFSVSFNGTEQDVTRVLQMFNVSVSSTLEIDGLQIVCGNSARLAGGVILDGARVNLQIAYKDGTVTVGSPLILGDY